MKKTKFVSSLAMLAIGITCFLPAAANAETVSEKEKAQVVSEEVNVSDEKVAIEKIPSQKDEDQKGSATEENVVEETKTTVENAQLVVTTSEKTTTIDLNETNQLSKIAEEYGLILSEYRDSKGEVLDPEYKVSDKEKVLLFKSEVSAKSETVELQIPTIEKKSNKIYVGEKTVESEGKKGKALKTFVETTDLSADKKINAEATTDTAPTAQVDSLTVLVKPEPKIVLIGTKERPKPVIVEEPIIEEEPVVEETEIVEEVETETTESDVAPDSNISEKTSSVDADRDPISGEPLNTKKATSSSSSAAPIERSSTSGSSSAPNGKKVAASSKKPSSIVSSKKERGQKAVDLAYTRLGSDYNWASSGEHAFDCSGLIHWVYKQNLGVDIPRTAKQQGSSAQQISISQLQPGDLLWTNSHIGLYIGNGEMIHASRSNDEVVVSGIGWFLDDGAKAARIK